MYSYLSKLSETNLPYSVNVFTFTVSTFTFTTQKTLYFSTLKYVDDKVTKQQWSYLCRGEDSSGAQWVLFMRMSQGPPGAPGAHPVGVLPACLAALQPDETVAVIVRTLLSGFLTAVLSALSG